MHSNDCGALIKHIHCAMQKNANNELRDADLTFAQIHLLFTLRDQPEGCCSLKELERKMKVAQSTTAGLVKRSGEKGFVECYGDSEDRRAKFARITNKGLDICRETEEKIRLSEERLVKHLNEDEKDMLVYLLKKVYTAISLPQ